ncbi:FG-GAP repeat domain-containing protein [Paractinoplanes atraurantiacus]|uniref:Repeat domain-containing protein n=1 Tax=Paractinoplanes atraurantiacus TaxID=1036182 RepID=A0A285K925_9ACTN|nr:VCBS repeat-containing protein [Actinoplanes atraurantiacus]SNY67821.1 Repeat domain-containing protein [Actinoplanes atraurantiacus]
MKNVYRRLLATMVGGALAATAGTAVPAPAIAAAAPSEVTVIPAEEYPYYDTSRTDTPVFAGETGFLHRRTSTSPWLWTTYADRRSVVVDALNGVPYGGALGVFGDTVELRVSTAGHPLSATTRWTLDLASMTWHEIDMPFNWAANMRQIGDSLLLISSTYQPELRRSEADGSYTTTPVTGIPAGADLIRIVAGDDETAVLMLHSPTGYQYGLLDAATGRVALIPGFGVATKVVLSEDRVGFYLQPAVRTYSRAGIGDGSDTSALTFTVPGSNFGLAGNDLIVAPPTNVVPWNLQRYTPDGAAPEKVSTARSTVLVQAPDGVFFVGGTDGTNSAVRKATATGQSVVLPLTEMVSAGITFARGWLRRVSALEHTGEAPEYYLNGHQLTPGTGTGGLLGGKLSDVVPCEAGATCVHAVDGALGGISYLTGAVSLRTGTTGLSGAAIPLPSTGGTVVDASRNYRIVNGTGPARQYIVGPDDKIASTGPVTGAGLWFDTLWTASAGRLQPKNLKSGALGAAVTTGSPCTATDVQATGKHVLWSCGPAGATGVYDLARKTTRALPAGQYLLGDNYAVRHDADGTLIRYDLTDGATATLATFPRGDLADDRNITWAVDKYSGNIAWVDGDDAAHIVDPGVTRSAPAAASVSPSDLSMSYPGSFSVYATLTRPVSGATLAITQARTGQVIRLTGPAARDAVSVAWNGTFAGKRPANGLYRWTLSAVTGGIATAVASGSVTVHCGGTPPLHGYTCDGLPTLLGVGKTTTGSAAWLTAQPGTAALAVSGPEALGALTAVVPYGDIAKDLKNDLLVRRADGTLRAYLSDPTPNFYGNRTVLIAGNWNRFNALVHTGDLTGDGVSDLLARETSTGRLFRFTGNGKGGFSSSAAYGGAYKGVSRFVGPGDITGDGKADLILLYGTTMYAWYGNGKGGFTPGLHLIGSGYLGFNTIIGAGDLNEDGKNDLLMRNSAGVLWRKLGNGKGGFGPLQLVGTGYQKYAALY